MALSGSKASFNEVPEAFDRVRPGYPTALYQDLTAYQPLGPRSRVLEIGIGTGQATEPILQTGCRLTAVELGDQLSALARHKFAAYPAFDVCNAAFEGFEAEAGSFDLIYAASSFHWIPPEVGFPKVLRLLRPGGAFVRFAHHPDYEDRSEGSLFSAIQRVYQVYMPGSSPAPPYTLERAQARAQEMASYGFVDVEARLYPTTRTLNTAQYQALLSTYSDHRALGPEKMAGLIEGVGAAIDAFGGELTQCDAIDMELGRKP